MFLGEVVSEARARAGISQRELAIRAGTSQGAISRIEAGLEEPSFERFRALMMALGLRPTLGLEPLSRHDAEPRRLIEQSRMTPQDRFEDGLSWLSFLKRWRQAGVDARS